MSYTKIYYDDIWAATSKGSEKCNNWLTTLSELSESFTSFVESDSFKGQAADNMKSYIKEVHGTLVTILGNVIQAYSVLAIDYYGGYTRLVDSGDSDKYGLRYTTIVSGEVSDTGSIQRKLNNIIGMTERVARDANSVKNSISDLVSISSYPKTSNLYSQIGAAKSKAQTVHNNAINYEASRGHDFDEIDRLISQAKAIINAQTKNRVPMVAYQPGSIGTMCDLNQIVVDLEATSEKITAITEDECFEEDASLVLNRDALIKEEEEASREWVQWVAVGIAVAGAIVLTVVTAGGAAPGVCIAVGAVTGGLTAASSGIADNYVEKGTFFKGLDVKEFGKDVAVGIVGGAVTGYIGAVSTGSAIKQPIQKGMTCLATTVMKEGAEGATATLWETGETLWEVGEAVVAGKPGDEIVSVLNAGLDETADEIGNTFKDMATEGAKSFVGGTVAGAFDIDTSEKGVLRKIGEKAAEGAAGSAAKGAVSTAWGVGEALVDGDSSTTVTSALKEGVKGTIQDVAKESIGAVVSEGVFSGVDDIDNKTGKVIMETVKDTTTDTVENITEGVTGRTMDYIYGDEKDSSKILGDIWEEDLDSGREIFKSAGEAAGEHISDEVYADRKHYNEMKKIDKDGDGKIEVVQFDEYTVTKQDYDAAVENAGKGAYKDQTAQEILGLNRDTDLDSGKHQTVDIDYTEAHKDNDNPFTTTVTVEGKDGEKYVYTKEYYDSTVNAAGTEDYEGRKLRDMLGVPEDTKLKDNTTTNTVRTDSIGKGKDVELHQQSGTNATKIDISTTSRQEKEEAEKQRKKLEKMVNEAAKEINKNIKNYKFENE